MEKDDKKEVVVPRAEDGTFLKGVSGNPAGRPKGSKNRITLLKQALELQLRQQAEPDMPGVMEKAIEMALEGHPGMIKLLLEMHVAKNTSDDKEGKERVEININSNDPRPITQIIESTSHTEEIIENEE